MVMVNSVTRAFRFGHQLRSVDGIDAMIAEAKQAEAAGYHTVTLPDHIGETMDSPLIVLAALARETSTIRLGTFVLNNEMRNPVQLAWEAATLDRLSNGRLELGLGAGHTSHEFAATGLDLAPAAKRKQRLFEAIQIIRPLLDGETVNFDGDHYTIENASIRPALQERVPIMEAGNGTALLTHAARHSDIIGLNGLGKTLADGQRHTVKFAESWLEHQITTIREAATGRVDVPELNALVQRIVITDDRQRAAADMAAEIETMTAEEALTTPYMAVGTHRQIVDHFTRIRQQWGISYFVSRDIEAMAPIVAALT